MENELNIEEITAQPPTSELLEQDGAHSRPTQRVWTGEGYTITEKIEYMYPITNRAFLAVKNSSKEVVNG